MESYNPQSIGVAIRPLGKYLTLIGNSYWNDKMAFEDAEYSAGAELNFPSGLRLYGDYNFESENMTVGFKLDFPHTAFGMTSPMDADNEIIHNEYYAHTSFRRFDTFIPTIGKKTLELTFDRNISEQKRSGFLWFSSGSKQLIDILHEIERATQSDDIENLVIYWENPSIGFAKATELRGALKRFKDSGKGKITFFSRNLDNTGFYIASVSDNIVMTHVGHLMLNGLSSEIMYWGGTFDKIGVKFDVITAGKFKDPGVYSKESMPEQVREEYEAVFSSLYNDFKKSISDRTGGSIEKAQEIIDNGPYTTLQAMELGLIDTILYADEWKDYVKGSRISSGTFESYKLRDEDFASKDKIAIIYADGEIISGSSRGGGLFSSSTVGSDDIECAVNAVLQDHSVKAVVLRVSSPGGSAQASEDMLHHLNRIIDRKIPLIVSMGGVAASGGYYISSNADHIFADPTTITGSIGVIMMKPSVGGLFEKIGLNIERIEYGDNSTIFSLYDSLSTSQKALLDKSILETYDVFKRRVSDGRELSMEAVEEIAQGRIWSGSDALKNGLVDSLGSFTDAINYAAEQAGIDEYKVVTFTGRKSSQWMYESFSTKIKPDLQLFGKNLKLPDFPYQHNEPLFLIPANMMVE